MAKTWCFWILLYPCGLWIIGVQPTSLILWAPSTYLSKQPLMYISISLIRLYTPTFPFILSDFHQGKLRLVFKERVTYIWKKRLVFLKKKSLLVECNYPPYNWPIPFEGRLTIYKRRKNIPDLIGGEDYEPCSSELCEIVISNNVVSANE